MTTSRVFRHFRPAALALVLALPLASPARAASRAASSDPLALVPADAASVAVVRLSDLRNSPLGAKIFAHADRLTVDGDAARFLEEAQLNPKTDVDVVVIAARPSSGGGGSPALALFEGRFEPDRLAGAATARGASLKASSTGNYYLLPDKHDCDSERPAAVAFVSSSLVIAGTESAVVQALADRQAGGSGFAAGSGLGRELKRVDRSATAWVLVDVNRYPAVARRAAHVQVSGEVNGEPAAAVMGAMKSVSLVAVQATARGDGLDLMASGVARDADSRQLLEDSLRGLLAMFRLAVQDKSPELVPAIRQFTVSSDSDSVTIHGTLSGTTLRALSQKKRHSDD
jgi:hypothetical protein